MSFKNSYVVKKESSYAESERDHKIMKSKYCPIIKKRCKGSKCSAYQPSQCSNDLGRYKTPKGVTPYVFMSDDELNNYRKEYHIYHEPYCKIIDDYDGMETVRE